MGRNRIINDAMSVFEQRVTLMRQKLLLGLEKGQRRVIEQEWVPAYAECALLAAHGIAYQEILIRFVCKLIDTQSQQHALFDLKPKSAVHGAQASWTPPFPTTHD